MNPLISVIVPVYNVEKYIEKCIESILQQDYKNIEIILIDDGSTDRSGKIIDLYKEYGICIIHKNNGGVSSARNVGLSISKGEYIVFIDGDDFVESNYVSYLYSLVSENNVEIAISCDYFRDVEVDSKLLKNDQVKKVTGKHIIKGIYLGDYNVAVWNKIYNSKMLKENNILFNEKIWYGEGMLFNIEALTHVGAVAVGQTRVYHQVFNPMSAVRNFSLNNNLCGLRSMEIQHELIKDYDKSVKDSWTYHFQAYGYSILEGLYEIQETKNNKKICSMCRDMLRNNLYTVFKVKTSIKSKLFYIAVAIAPDLMAMRGAKKKRRIKKRVLRGTK